MKKLLLLICIFLFGGLFAISAMSAEIYNVPIMSSAPKMDGYVNTKEWKGAIKFDGFSINGDLQPRRVIGYVGATENNIYIAIVSELPKQGKILANVKQDVKDIVFDDAVEVWIDPNPKEKTGITYQMLCNSLGDSYYKTYSKGDVKSKEYYDWTGNYKIVNKFHNGWWNCEIEIPVKNLVKGRKTTAGEWEINLCRDFKQPWAWASIGTDYDFGPGNRIIFKFSKENGVVVQQKNIKNPIYGNIDYIVSMYNPLQKQIEVKADVFLKRKPMPNFSKQEIFVLNSGEEKKIKLQVMDHITNKFQLSTIISSPDGKDIYFSRNYNWQNWGKPGEKRKKWQTTKIEIPPIDFVFANYPYLHKMKILADIFRLENNSKVKQLQFKIIDEKNKKVVKEFNFGINEFKDGKCEKVISLPPLSGNYEIALKAVGENVPSGEIIKTFQNTVFPWEHNKLGISNKVYPPFTPIKKIGNNLYTVLKQYTMNNLGLLSSVITQENHKEGTKKEILNSEMNYIAIINGKVSSPEKAKIRYTKVAGDRIIMNSKFNIGEIPVSSVSKLDYDGTLKVEVTLHPSSKEIDSLILYIPLKNKIAKDMHAMGCGMRSQILTASVPSGEGVVWDATKIPLNAYPKNFCTYIYLGDSRRGLCWFASNDKGWSWNPNKPNMQIVRKEGILTLQINLVNKPIIIKKPRTIIFGILAAPVKPRVPGWRYKWYTEQDHVIGTDISWFALGGCSSVYPVAKDLYLWKMLKEGNEKHLSNAEIEKIYPRVLKDYAPYKTQLVKMYTAKSFKDFVRLYTWNDLGFYGWRMIFYYDRASYAEAPEFQTFMDEWCEQNFNPYRGKNQIGEIDIVPSKSFDDYSLYWYGKSFDIAGNKGIYTDNYYLEPTYNTMMSSAYRKKDGTIMPSTGIWKLRKLIKREFVYMNQRGMTPTVMEHITSVSILPLLSFATLQFDWEYPSSQVDFQDRKVLSRRYIRIVSDGELAGTWPVVENEEGFEPWTQKTYIGVTLVHDLIGEVPTYVKSIGALWKTYREPFIKMAENNKNMVTHRYWDSGKQPVCSKNHDLPGIVYFVYGKEALYGICSYANKNLETTIHIIPNILGFTNYKVIDVSTEKKVSVENNSFNLFIKKHDLKIFKIIPY